MIDRFRGAAGRNLVPDGTGYHGEGEPSKEELALNSAQMRAFGSPEAYAAFREFERAMLAFYGCHLAADTATAGMDRDHRYDATGMQRLLSALSQAHSRLGATWGTPPSSCAAELETEGDA